MLTGCYSEDNIKAQYQTVSYGVVAVMSEQTNDEGKTGNSLGTGFFIQENLIVTNAHVVGKNANVKIKMRDNNKIYDATVVRASPMYDLALVRISKWKEFKAENPKLQILEFGNNNDLKHGDPVYSIGHPFGMMYTLAEGVVSHPYRRKDFQFFIQTDTLIQTGNSGGPLFNSEGKVIGVNSMIISSGTGSSFGMSIPSYLVKRLIPTLLSTRPVGVAKIGIKMGPSPDQTQVMISEVDPNGPAWKSGLAPNDIILSYTVPNLKLVKNVYEPDDLLYGISQVPEGETIVLFVKRGKTVQSISVKTGLSELEKYTAPGMSRGFSGGF